MTFETREEEEVLEENPLTDIVTNLTKLVLTELLATLPGHGHGRCCSMHFKVGKFQ